MRAEIVTIGSELLTPRRSDTNSTYLTAKLSEVGIPVIFRATVGDDRALIADTFRRSIARSELVIATGGLGPTADDLTREAVGDALGLTFDENVEIVEALRRRFEKRGIPMPEVNLKQALVPRGAEVLPNRFGSAPGLWIVAGGALSPDALGVGPQGNVGRPLSPDAPGVGPRGMDKEARWVALLPGPPHELHPMFESEVLPRLQGRKGALVYRVKLLYIASLPESLVEEKVGEIYRTVENPSTTILAAAGQVELHLTAHAETAEAADDLNESLARQMREALGSSIFSETAESLEGVVGRLLVEKRLSLAVAESITGGLITHRLTEVPGSSRYLERGFVTYSNRSKIELLGVPESLIAEHGAVSAPVAEAMAQGARERAGTDFGVAVTGIAGPDGGSPEKPVGLVYIALADASGVSSEKWILPRIGRSQIKWWTAQSALDRVRLRLLEGLRHLPDCPGAPPPGRLG